MKQPHNAHHLQALKTTTALLGEKFPELKDHSAYTCERLYDLLLERVLGERSIGIPDFVSSAAFAIGCKIPSSELRAEEVVEAFFSNFFSSLPPEEVTRLQPGLPAEIHTKAA
ncbi:hypothetical protein WDW86_20910 [Bdellovibrionota bacterium FG-2]